MDSHLPYLKSLIQGRKIYLWGAGKEGLSCVNKARDLGLAIYGFIDADRTKQGSLIDGLPVISPSELFARGHRDFYIIIAVCNIKMSRDIIHICETFNLGKGKDYTESQLVFSPDSPTVESIEMFFPREKNIVEISDFPYTPRARPSFSRSRIGRLLEEDLHRKKSAYEVEALDLLRHRDVFASISLDRPEDLVSPFWNNMAIPPIDGAVIYGFLVKYNPRYYVECGSGNTTKFAARAVRDHGLRTKIYSIDPSPRANVDMLVDYAIRMPLENVDMDFFKQLSQEDFFIMDGSHRAFPNSDVTVFFTEILPNFPTGLIYAIHDIGLPYELFPELYYNEQYMLSTYLVAGAMGDTILFPTSVLGSQSDVLKDLNEKMNIPNVSFQSTGGFFWMRKA